MTAEIVYKVLLVVIAVAILAGGVIDTYLGLSGQQTITAYLRRHPGWFVVPALTMAAFLLGLSLHLFVFVQRGTQ